MKRAGWLFAAGLFAALIAGGAQAGCRVALALAVDVSSSVDSTEYELQRGGLAAALRHPDVHQAILGGPGHVALAVYEWSGRRQHHMVVDWTALHGPRDIELVAATFEATPRSHSEFPTALGYALGYGHSLLRRAPPCARQVIDLSGDGKTNDGFGAQLAYKHYGFDTITVNGLAIEGADDDVLTYFQRQVAHGPLSFVEVAHGHDDIQRAMIRKLIRELSEMVVGALPVRRPPPHDR